MKHLPSIFKALNLNPSTQSIREELHNLTTSEVEEEEWGIPSHHLLQFKVSLGYIKSCFKNKICTKKVFQHKMQ